MPLLLFAIFQIGFSAREQRRVIEARALNLSEQIIIRADGETSRIATVLDALGTAQALRESDWTSLGNRFLDFQALYPDLEGLTVKELATGRTVLTVGLGPATVLQIADGRAASRPRFVGYARVPGCKCLLFERLGRTDTGRSVILSIATNSALFLEMLPPVSEQVAAAALNGPKARFIARNVDHDGRFSTMSSTYLQKAVAPGEDRGFYRGVTLEQVENYTAFARSSHTGWTAHVALGSAYIDDPARRFLASIGVAAVLSLLLAVLLIAFAMRQMRAARLFTEKMQQSQKLEALGQLTGGLAHDFNNLLTPVIGTLDQLSKRESLDERGRRLAKGALASAQRAAKLTSQLLAFSRRQKLTILPVPVQPLAADVGDLIERSLGTKHSFSVHVDPEVRCVASDRNQLEVGLLNLALNARDASPDGGPITLDVRGDGDGHILFKVTDHGKGMDEATRSRALEPFFTTKQLGHGTGLGLAQVFGVVSQSGGTMTIESKPDQGTTVILRLPACEPDDDERIASAGAPVASLDQRLRLLVVDDDDAVRATLAGLLVEDGHAVEAVASGTSALALLHEHGFDLILVDFFMPGMTGAELIRAARDVREDCRFLLVSGYADSSEIAAASEHTPILRKPFTAEELRTAVAKTCRLQPPS
jgi:signal transduction histidine kinase